MDIDIESGQRASGDAHNRSGQTPAATGAGLQQALGWFSIGLGVVELLQPRALNRAIGTDQHPGVTRFCGLREIVSGVGMLSGRAPAAWAWSRVAGDAMDLALLAGAASSGRSDLARIALATTAVLGVAALDVEAARAAGASVPSASDSGSARVRASITINSSAEELYGFWRSPENLPRFMRHLRSVAPTGERTSRWTANGPAGRDVSWDSEITTDIPNQRISWRTLPDSGLTHTGTVTFEPATNGVGTVVRVEMEYQPPAGAVGDTVAKLLGIDPQHQISDDLRRLKQLQETGEVATTQGQPDRVVVPFPISCGNCYFCEREQFSLCENSNPNLQAQGRRVHQGRAQAGDGPPEFGVGRSALKMPAASSTLQTGYRVCMSGERMFALAQS